MCWRAFLVSRPLAPAGRMPQGDEAWREGVRVEMIPHNADVSTLLRQMRQLCV
jgi:hypothetical protein